MFIIHYSRLDASSIIGYSVTLHGCAWWYRSGACSSPTFWQYQEFRVRMTLSVIHENSTREISSEHPPPCTMEGETHNLAERCALSTPPALTQEQLYPRREQDNLKDKET